MSAALDARGLKRVCAGCGARYYDFNKRPVKCPSCDTEFSAEVKLKTRRGRVAAIAEAVEEKAAPEIEADENIEVADRDEGVVSLEDVDEGKDDAEEDDIAIEGDIEDIEDIEEEIEEDLAVEVEKD